MPPKKSSKNTTPAGSKSTTPAIPETPQPETEKTVDNPAEDDPKIDGEPVMEEEEEVPVTEPEELLPPTLEEEFQSVVSRSFGGCGFVDSGDKYSMLNLSLTGEHLAETPASSVVIKDLSFLKSFTHLQTIDVSGHQVECVRDLCHLPNICQATLSRNRIASFCVLCPLENLVDLDVSYNQIASICSLGSLTMLQRLNVAGNKVNDLTGLGHLRRLTELNLERNEITSTLGLGTLTNLKSLNLNYNFLDELSDISALVSLRSCQFRNNKIETLVAFADGAFPVLVELDAANNEIIHPYEVVLVGNKETLRSIDLSHNPIQERENYRFLIVFSLPMLGVLDAVPVDPREKVKAANQYGDDPNHDGVVSALDAGNSLTMKEIVTERLSTDTARSAVLDALLHRVDPNGDRSWASREPHDYQMYLQRSRQLRNFDGLRQAFFDKKFLRVICELKLLEKLRELVLELSDSVNGPPYTDFASFLTVHRAHLLECYPEQTEHITRSSSNVPLSQEFDSHPQPSENHRQDEEGDQNEPVAPQKPSLYLVPFEEVGMQNVLESSNGGDAILCHLAELFSSDAKADFGKLTLRFSPCSQHVLLLRENWCVGILDLKSGVLRFSERYQAVSSGKYDEGEVEDPLYELPWRYLKVHFNGDGLAMLSFSNIDGIQGEYSVIVELSSWKILYAIGKCDVVKCSAGPASRNPLYGLVELVGSIPTIAINDNILDSSVLAYSNQYICAEGWNRNIFVHQLDSGDLMHVIERVPPESKKAGSRASWKQRIAPVFSKPGSEPDDAPSIIAVDPYSGCLLVSPPLSKQTKKYTSKEPMDIHEVSADSRLHDADVVDSIYLGGPYRVNFTPVNEYEQCCRWRCDGQVRDGHGVLADFADGVSRDVGCSVVNPENGNVVEEKTVDIFGIASEYFRGPSSQNQLYQGGASEISAPRSSILARVISTIRHDQGLNMMNEASTTAVEILMASVSATPICTLSSLIGITALSLNNEGTRVAIFSSDVRCVDDSKDKPCSIQKELMVIQIEPLSSGLPVQQKGTAAIQMVFSKDGSMLAVAFSDNILRVWSIDKEEDNLSVSGTIQQQTKMVLDGGKICSTAFSPDNRYLAVVTLGSAEFVERSRHEVSIWSLASSEKLCTVKLNARKAPKGQTNLSMTEPLQVEFSFDGKLIAVGTSSGVFFIDIQDAITSAKGTNRVASDVAMHVPEMGKIQALAFADHSNTLAVVASNCQMSEEVKDIDTNSVVLYDTRPGDEGFLVDLCIIGVCKMDSQSTGFEVPYETSPVQTCLSLSFSGAHSKAMDSSPDRFLVMQTNHSLARFDLEELGKSNEDNEDMNVCHSYSTHKQISHLRGNTLCTQELDHTILFGESCPFPTAATPALMAHFDSYLEVNNNLVQEIRRLSLPPLQAGALHGRYVATCDFRNKVAVHRLDGLMDNDGYHMMSQQE